MRNRRLLCIRDATRYVFAIPVLAAMALAIAHTACAYAATPSREKALPEAGPSARWIVDRGPAPVLEFGSAQQSLVPRPAIVFLHGMCDDAPPECAAIAPAAADRLLLCPRGNLVCSNGGFQYGGSAVSKRALAFEALDAAQKGDGTQTANTLAGFSLGAIVAAEIAPDAGGRFANLLLVGAKVRLDPDKLRAAGVRNVLLAAGDFDQAAPAMQREAKRLSTLGIRAEFRSLGPVGHTFARDMPAWMRDALAWFALAREESGVAGR